MPKNSSSSSLLQDADSFRCQASTFPLHQPVNANNNHGSSPLYLRHSERLGIQYATCEKSTSKSNSKIYFNLGSLEGRSCLECVAASLAIFPRRLQKAVTEGRADATVPVRETWEKGHYNHRLWNKMKTETFLAH